MGDIWPALPPSGSFQNWLRWICTNRIAWVGDCLTWCFAREKIKQMFGRCSFFCTQYRSVGLCHKEFHNIYRLVEGYLKSQVKPCPFAFGLNSLMQPQGLSWSSKAQHQRADWRRAHWGGVQLGRKWSQEAQSYRGGDGRHGLSDFEHWKRQTWKTKAGWNTSCFFLMFFWPSRVSIPSLWTQWCAYRCGTIENLELFTWKSSSCSKQLDLVLSKIECFRLELIFQSTYHGWIP